MRTPLRTRFSLLLVVGLAAVLPVRVAEPAGAQTCSPSVTVTSLAAFNDAIGCFNSRSSGSHEITIRPGTTLRGATRAVDNDTSARLTIVANGAAIDGAGATTPLIVRAGNVTLTGGTLRNGAATEACFSGVCGGAVFVGFSAGVAINNAVLIDSVAAGDGGAVFVEGTLTLTGSTVDGNAADNGGAVAVDVLARATITRSVLSGNTATTAGGAVTVDIEGDVEIVSSSVIGNESAGLGGAVAGLGSGSVVIVNSTVADNSAGTDGGALAINATAHLAATTLLGNRAAGTAEAIFFLPEGALVTDNTAISSPSADGVLCVITGFGSPLRSTGAGGVADDDTCGSPFIESSTIALGPIRDNGCPSRTAARTGTVCAPTALGPGSSGVVGAGNPATCTAVTAATGRRIRYDLSTDQAGTARSSVCNAGSTEFGDPDPTPPTARITVTPTPTAAGWNRTPVTVTFEWTDANGIDETACETTRTVTASGTTTAQASCRDRLGNIATASTIVRIDTTRPTVAITSNTGAATGLARTAIGFAGSDSGSGIASYRCTINGSTTGCTSPASYNDLRVGTNTFSVVAVDAAGNTSTADQTVWTVSRSLGVGYWMLGRNGEIYGFGAADAVVPTGTRAPVTSTAVKILEHPDGNGLWVLEENGTIHAFGGAAAFGPVDRSEFMPGERVATMAAMPGGRGLFVFTDRGRTITFGTARHLGDLVELGIAGNLNGPIIDSTAIPDGSGYYMLGTDGGVFSFGTARFAGSVPGLGITLNSPTNGIVADPDGTGYWLVAGDGGVFGFDAPFVGSIPGILPPGASLLAPVNGLVPFGNGYLMVASDGGVFSFSDLPFVGSLGGQPIPSPIVGIATLGR